MLGNPLSWNQGRISHIVAARTFLGKGAGYKQQQKAK
jgi:hypothetical protein